MSKKRQERIKSRAAKPLSAAKPAPQASASSLPPWLYPAAITLATLLAYLNSFGVPFLFDDKLAIVDNETIRSIWPLTRSFWGPDETGVSGRPFLNFTFALNHALSGYAVWSYHLFNLAIHIAAALGLYGLARRTLRLPVVRDRWGGSADGFAFALALLWAVHPIQTESVTYLIARNESLMGMFYILTLYAVARCAENERPFAWGAAAVGACLLGMASKETMGTAPLLALLFDRAFAGGSFEETLRRRWRLHAALAATWILLAVLIWAGPRQETTGLNLQEIGPLDYLKLEAPVILRYLRLALWPHPLIFDYGWAVPKTWGEIALPFAAVSALFAGACSLFALRPTVGFLAIAFFIILGPTSSVMPTNEACWEYRMYLPLAPVLALALLGARRLLELAKSESAFGAGAIVLAVVCIGLSLRRNHDYRNEIALLEDTVRKLPDGPRAINNLGEKLYSTGDLARSMPLFERAAELEPRYSDAQYNLGTAKYQQGMYEEALRRLELAVKHHPGRARPRNNLGMTLVKLKRPAEALPHLEEALRIEPGNREAKINRAAALDALGRLDEAIDAYKIALEADPENAAAHNNLGVALAKKGRLAEAAEEFRLALKFKPGYPDAVRNLKNAENMLSGGAPAR